MVSPGVRAPTASPPASPGLAAPPASEPAGATPLVSSASEVPSEIPLVVDEPSAAPAGEVRSTSPSPSPDDQQPTLTMEGPGKQSRTILLQEAPLVTAPLVPAPPVAPARAPVAPEIPSSQTDPATVRFDLGDLTPVDAAPVALLIASRQQSEKHDAPASALEAHESPAQLSAPKPRAEASGKRGGVALRRASWLMRALADARSATRLLVDSAKFYGKNVRAFALLMTIVLLPTLATKSCLVAASTGSAGAIATTLDLSRVREDLTRRAQASKAQGQVDKAALAELAALETVDVVQANQPPVEAPSEFVRTARWVGAALLTGVFMLGLAIPLGFGAVAMLFVEQTAMSRWLSVFEILNRLWRRRLSLASSLLPAALIVAVGCALFMVPGMLAAALFLFVPAIVIFEHSSGRAVFARSLGLVRAEAVRVVVVILVACAAGAAAYLLAGALMPEGTRRIHVFLRLLSGDALMLAIFPVPALAVARLYVDARAREGETPATLVHAGRRETPAGLAHAARR